LFTIDSVSAGASALLPDLAIAPEQIRRIREAFVRTGILEQEDRRTIVESVAGRAVASLGELRAVEATRIINRISERSTATPAVTGSAWDTREEETWIDKM
jgi:DNA polymerase-3 subunit epsilon